MKSRLPQPSFVSMIDAVLCAVCVLIILVVVAPRQEKLVGETPRAEWLVKCDVGADILKYEIALWRAGKAKPVNVVKVDEIGGATGNDAVAAMRQSFETQFGTVPRLSTRVAVAIRGGADASCIDLVRCAFATDIETCDVVAGIGSWNVPEGIARPVLSYVYSTAVDPQ